MTLSFELLKAPEERLFNAIGWAADNASAIRNLCRRAFRPQPIEPLHEGIVVITKGNGLNEQTISLCAEKRVRMRGLGNADHKPEMLACEIGKTRGAIVDDKPVSKSNCSCRAGVRRREHIEVVFREEGIKLPLPLGFR